MKRDFLSDSDLAALWQRFRDHGCPEARAFLIQRYACLVPATLKRLLSTLPRFLDRDDLHSTGLIGLIHAIDAFDPTRGVKFETYAIALIRGAILETLRSADWATRPVRVRQKRLRAMRLSLEICLGRPPTDPELASALGLSLSELEQLGLDIARAALLSLDAPQEEKDRLTLAGLVADPDADPFEQAALRERDRTLHTALNWLPERERLVLRLYYDAELSFRAIGQRLCLSESRACQLHAQALRRLRAYLAHTTP